MLLTSLNLLTGLRLSQSEQTNCRVFISLPSFPIDQMDSLSSFLSNTLFNFSLLYLLFFLLRISTFLLRRSFYTP